MKKGKKRPLLYGFWAYICLSARLLSGEGYVVVPMIRKYFCPAKEDVWRGRTGGNGGGISISAGTIAVNLAAVTGFRVAGASGAIISAFASVFPPFLIMGVISHSYQAFIANHAMAAVLKGMQAGAAVLIAETAFGMCRNIWKEHNSCFPS